MDENARPSKRRRISHDAEEHTPASAKRAALDEGVNGLLVQNGKTQQAEASQEDAGDVSDVQSDEEPRRSGRARKPSARVLDAKKEVASVKQQRNTKKQAITLDDELAAPADVAKTPKSATKTTKAKGNATPKSQVKLVKPPSITMEDATPKSTPRKGRQPKAQTNGTGPTPTKRKPGRPKGAQSKVPIVQEKEVIADSEDERTNGQEDWMDVDASNGGEEQVVEDSDIDVDEIDHPTPAKKNGVKANPTTEPKTPTKSRSRLFGTTPQKSTPKFVLPAQESASETNAVSRPDVKPISGVDTFPTQHITDIVLTKLAQRRRIPLTNLDEEYTKVYNLLEATVSAGEGNSMLVVGARGSGKTTLVDCALAKLSKDQDEHFHVIRLNGFIQIDDKLALREIWRQLGREMDIDEEGSKSYADTLIMLLALLSHPDEITGEVTDGVAKSVIFVIDEFDMFASHARQTLLYNLLDIAQSRKAPIAVLGLTTKFDVTERLEKRVKSRFSHRYIYLSMPRSQIMFQDICKAAIQVQLGELTLQEKMILDKTASSYKESGKKGNLNAFGCLQLWNTSVDNLFYDTKFLARYIRPTYHLSKSVPAVLTSLLLPLSSLSSALSSSDTTLLPPSHFLSPAHLSLLAPTSTLHLILPSLSELQLSLLIAAARLDVIHDSDTCSFGMAYAEYVDLAGKARIHSAAAGAMAIGAGSRVWGREVARGEWENLIRHGLLVPVTEAGGANVVASVGGLVRIDVKLEEIPSAVPGISAMMERWCKQI